MNNNFVKIKKKKRNSHLLIPIDSIISREINKLIEEGKLDTRSLVLKKKKVRGKNGKVFYRKYWTRKEESAIDTDEHIWGRGCKNYLSNTKSDEQIKQENPDIPMPEKISASEEEREFADNAVKEYNAKGQYGDPSTYVKKYKNVDSKEYRRLKRESLPDDVPNDVRKVYNDAIIAEKEITDILEKVSKSTGGTMFGKDFRIKEGDSFWRKVQKEHKRINSNLNDENFNPKSLSEVAKANTDTVRYTNISQPENLVSDFKKTKKALEDSGCELVKVHNNFTDPKWALNCLECIFQHPSGQKFELWFHTPETKHVQDNGGHKYYEALRVMDNEKDQRKCEQVVFEMFYKCKFPKDIEKISNFNNIKESFLDIFLKLSYN